MGRIAIIALMLMSMSSAGGADTIQVDYNGIANGIRPTIDPITGQYSLGGFSKPFSADFIFDTDMGTLTSVTGGYRLDGGLVSAFIDLDELGTWGGSGSYFNAWGASSLTWQSDFSSVLANAGGTYFHLWTDSAGTGGFQFGLCPTTVGGPCGRIMSIDSSNITSAPLHTPNPTVGTGLPSLLVLLLLGLAMRFRPQHNAN